MLMLEHKIQILEKQLAVKHPLLQLDKMNQRIIIIPQTKNKDQTIKEIKDQQTKDQDPQQQTLEMKVLKTKTHKTVPKPKSMK